MNNVPSIPAADIPAIVAAGGLILDVRTRSEHVQQRLAADHAFQPLAELDPAAFMKAQGLDKNTPVFILCRTDNRATNAAKMFADAGYPNAVVIEGGILAAAAAGVALAGTLVRKKPRPPRP